jgi:hypothetical protein
VHAGAVAELRKWVARNQRFAAAVAAAVLLALVGLAATLYVQGEARAEEAELNRRLSATNAELSGALASESAALAEAQAARAEVERALASARWQSYLANVRAAALHLDAGSAAEARRRLDACPPEHRAWEWDHLDPQSAQSQAVLRGHPGAVRWVVISRTSSSQVAAPDAECMGARHGGVDRAARPRGAGLLPRGQPRWPPHRRGGALVAPVEPRARRGGLHARER